MFRGAALRTPGARRQGRAALPGRAGPGGCCALLPALLWISSPARVLRLGPWAEWGLGLRATAGNADCGPDFGATRGPGVGGGARAWARRIQA